MHQADLGIAENMQHGTYQIIYNHQIIHLSSGHPPTFAHATFTMQ